MSLGSNSFAGPGCKQESLFFNTRMLTKVLPSNDVEKNYNIIVDDARITLSQMAISVFNCTPAIEADVEYSLK